LPSRAHSVGPWGIFFGLSPQVVTGLISPLACRHAKISKAHGD
jgi:hypothetical protein